jgi:hypothetical protein
MPLENFSQLAQSKGGRNLANMDQLDVWLGKVMDDKLGQSDRAQKARGWVATVGRRRMAREGEASEASAGQAGELAKEHPWAAKAVQEGRSLHLLALTDAEAEGFSKALDWMRSDQGPSLSSDWSKISWPQALEAHDAWVERMAREAGKRVSAGQAFEGCDPVAAVEGIEGLEGWSWVKPKTAQALEREGALMRHCVGSYAEEVEEGSLDIWSLRDPAGKPFLTVSTRLRREGGGFELREAKGFANRAPSSAHALALGSLFEHLKERGVPIKEAGPDLANAGLAITPPGFGAEKLWRKGDVSDENEALARIQAAPEILTSKRLAQRAEFAGSMGYRGALRALASKMPKAGLGADVLARVQTSAWRCGLAWGAGLFAGQVFDPKSQEESHQAARTALAKGGSLGRESLLETAEFLANAGWSEPLRALTAPLAKLESQDRSSLEALNRRMLDGAAPMALWQGRLWMGASEEQDDLVALTRAVTDPATGRDAFAMCARLGHADAMESLARWASGSESHVDAERAGCFLESGDLGENKLWRSKRPDQAKEAQERARANPNPGNPILPIALKLGYDEAAREIFDRLDGPQALGLACEFAALGIDAVRFGARADTSREDLMLLRDAAARNGLIEGAQQALTALEALPESAFSDVDKDYAQALRDSFPRWRRSFDAMTQAINEVASNPCIARGLVQGQARGAEADLLASSPAWRVVRERVTESTPETLGVFVECLSQALSGSCPGMRMAGRAELPTPAKEAFAHFFVQTCSSEQRQALIGAITGFKRKPPQIERMSIQKKRLPWGGEEPSWVGPRRRAMGR